MAAGQWRKQLASSSFHEEYRGKKKKKIDSSDYLLCLRSQVDLEWDVSRKRVVAKMEQVGITWTDMAPFIDSVTQLHSGVADVLSLPLDIFDLNNLSDVLTYEVWTTFLSESERKLLSQFLPSGTDTEQEVHSLLKGENYRFGNPLLKWSSSLCAGNLHPDNVLEAEQQFKSHKRAYYYEINNYHTGMIEALKKWRERWLSCKDPEKLRSERFTKSKKENLAISAERSKVTNFSEGEMSSMHNDSVKYMSCIKITRSQFQLIKNLKHLGDGIQSKSLSHVLGDINSFHVHPYETFEEEEKKRLHEHWFQVATKDLPTAFAVYKQRKLQREQCWKSLEKELAGRTLILDKDEKVENLESSSQESAHSGGFHQHKHAPDAEDEKDVDLRYKAIRYKAINDHQLEHIPSISPNHKTGCMIVDGEAVGEDALKQEDDLLSLSESLYSQNVNIKLEGTLSSAKHMWQPTNLSDSYYHTSQGHGYLSADLLSLRHKQVHKERPDHILDPERDIPEPEFGGPVASAFTKASDFCSFANQDRTELLPTFPEGSGLLSAYTHEQMNNVKQPALHSLVANDGLSDSGKFASQFQGQSQLLQQREVWEKGLYMHQNVNQNVYSTSRYPSKGHFPLAEHQGFCAIQSSENSDSAGYNWFPAENQTYSSWSGVETLSRRQCVGHGGNADGNPYSVYASRLTCSPFDTISSEQYVQARNCVGGIMTSAENTYGYTRTQLDNSGSRETDATSSLRKESWMNFPHQNTGLHNPGGRPFLRPWNL